MPHGEGRVRLPTIPGNHHVETSPFENRRQGFDDRIIIVDKQDAMHHRLG
jgi:hypothetical protein